MPTGCQVEMLSRSARSPVRPSASKFGVGGPGGHRSLSSSPPRSSTPSVSALAPACERRCRAGRACWLPSLWGPVLRRSVQCAAVGRRSVARMRVRRMRCLFWRLELRGRGGGGGRVRGQEGHARGVPPQLPHLVQRAQREPEAAHPPAAKSRLLSTSIRAFEVLSDDDAADHCFAQPISLQC